MSLQRFPGFIDAHVHLRDPGATNKEEKEKDPPAFGVPGLETAVGLMFMAAKEGKIAVEDVTKFLYTNPKAIFAIPDQPDTYVALDPDLEYIVGEDGYESKCGWSPFDGWKLYGKVQKVVLHGKTILEDGKIIL